MIDESGAIALFFCVNVCFVVNLYNIKIFESLFIVAHGLTVPVNSPITANAGMKHPPHDLQTGEALSVAVKLRGNDALGHSMILDAGVIIVSGSLQRSCNSFEYIPSQ